MKAPKFRPAERLPTAVPPCGPDMTQSVPSSNFPIDGLCPMRSMGVISAVTGGMLKSNQKGTAQLPLRRFQGDR